ncbi:CapA family protein [Amycolatopsis sp. NPDC051371]|uniref:CapA family protein n=1 Tax=Amycolatopsis sp. NPDC051371 TaxID=3155800 RepID=UPI003417C89D
MRERGALAPAWRRANVPDGFTVAAVGDLVVDDVLTPVLERRAPDLLALLRSADVTVGNFEGTAADLGAFGGWPEAEPGGSWLISTPGVPADLRRMGFDLVSRANNHTTDWGVAGMRATDRLLTAAGIAHAGTGETLADARAPRYLVTPAGRVALVSLASRFEPMARAADPLGRVPGRPGLNALRTRRLVRVPAAELAALARIRDALPDVKRSVLEADRREGTVTLFGTSFGAGDAVGVEYTMHDGDRRAVLRSVRQAKQTSDFTIAAVHTHEPGNRSRTAPEFLRTLAREAIDDGADLVAGHGPHQLRGIELHRGRPVFHSLGNFVFMENTQRPLTHDAYEKQPPPGPETTEAEYLEHKRVHGVFEERIWYESVVAVCRFTSRGRLSELRLQPIELHWNSGRDADRGIPRLARGSSATRILRRLQRLSAPLGTKLVNRGGVGYVDLR